MADNGDVTYLEIQSLLALGAPFPESSNSTLTQDQVDDICDNINAEVNLIVERLGFAMPVTAPNSVEWLELTKKFGAGSIVLDGMSSQNTEEENTRAQRWWDRYMQRLRELLDTGGEVLADADVLADPSPTRLPTVYGQRKNQKRFMRFPQRAAADQFTDEARVESGYAPWRRAIGGW